MAQTGTIQFTLYYYPSVPSDTTAIRDILMTGENPTYQAAGYEAYMSATTNPHDPSVLSSSSAFILYLAFITTIGSDDLARIVFELDIPRFLELIGLYSPFNTPRETITARLLMHAIALKLDPIQDSDAVASIKDKISTLKTSDSITLEGEVNASSLSLDTWARLEISYATVDRSLVTSAVLDAIKFIMVSHLLGNLQRTVNPPPTEDVKVLLLGSGECGKTTMLKQLILSHLGSERFFSQYQDAAKFRSDIVRDIVSSLEGLIQKNYALGYHYPGRTNGKRHSDMLKELNNVDGLNTLLAFIWAYTGGLELLQSLVDEKAQYYFSVLTRIAELPASKRESYEPTEEDLVRWYVQTTAGFHKKTFQTPTKTYHVWDCGGQVLQGKTEWSVCFPDVSVVLCVASLVDYDQIPSEGGYSNRLQQALDVFYRICHTAWCPQTRIVLVLTKRDCITELKLLQSPLEDHFPGYTGGADENAALNYIKSQFLKISHYSQYRNMVRMYALNVTSTEAVKVLFERNGLGF
ncbi:P-loop containing nucleoside triphosphate hydrolase protein [Marasmius fiardii PR-910]|nr:P-loop containing nucleoside triphosphate hydrolase protein [Marasmius fiardii PR-910]